MIRNPLKIVLLLSSVHKTYVAYPYGTRKCSNETSKGNTGSCVHVPSNRQICFGPLIRRLLYATF
jgi:hypothetical protein